MSAVSMTREQFITGTAKLIAGLAVPVSMHMPLGAAEPAWTELHRGLRGFGWATAEEYEEAIREILGPVMLPADPEEAL
jgi:hypothetical protein